MISDKKGIQQLVEVCSRKGIEHVVLSPGSRNAPLSISFNEYGSFTCVSIPDERCAAFFALGIAQQTRKPVAISCTSGSAALNYAPALAEAFYQKVPLLVLTADRPVEWIDQGEGQSIRQRNIYSNYILDSFEMPQEADHPDEEWSCARIANDAINLATHELGPVHINIPLRENLYQQKTNSANPRAVYVPKTNVSLAPEELDALAEKWENSSKKLVLAGQLNPDEKLNEVLGQISSDPSVVILTETTANICHPNFNPCIDRLISVDRINKLPDFRPEILVSIGGAIISKKIKALFRKFQPEEHWHIANESTVKDTFQSLTKHIRINPATFFRSILDSCRVGSNGYRELWRNCHYRSEILHDEYLETTPWSDLKAYQTIVAYLPDHSTLHMGNSTAVRYFQLFEPVNSIDYYCNRGVSGIDGSTSTAMGATFASQKPSTLVTGDISFLYDSNALWNLDDNSNLKIIVLNNGGGNIFKIIPGPDTTNQLNDFFVTKQNVNIGQLCAAFGILHSRACSTMELEECLKRAYSSISTPEVIEVYTANEDNDNILKSYFENLKK